MRQPYENKALPAASSATREALARARRLTDPAYIRDLDEEEAERLREKAKADADRLAAMLQRQQSTGPAPRSGDDTAA